MKFNLTYLGFIVLFLITCPPIPVYFTSAIFKLSGIIISVMLSFVVLNVLYRGKFKFFFPISGIFMFIILPIFYAIYGFYLNNKSYYILKELYFFSFPVLTAFIFSNLFTRNDNIIKSLIDISLIYSLIQIVVGGYGIFFDFTDRYHYRNEYVLFSTHIVPLGLVLSSRLSERIKDFCSSKNIIMILAILLTLGRNQVIFLLFFSCLYLCSFIFRNNKFLLFYIGLLFLAPLIYFLIPDMGLEIKDTAILWRFIESVSYWENVRFAKLSHIFFGNGLGSFLETVKPLVLYSGEIYYEIDRFHNLFLYLLFKMGVVGCLAFIIYLLLFLYKYRKYLKSRVILFLISYIMFAFLVIANTTGSFTMSLNNGLIMGISFYLLFSAKRHLIEEKT